MRLIGASTLLLVTALVALLQPVKTHSQPSVMPVAWQSQPQAAATPAPNPQDKAEVNSRIQSQLSSVFSGDPSLSGASVDTNVDDVAITLTGSVQSEGQHQRVLALASQFAQYRKIVDKIVVK